MQQHHGCFSIFRIATVIFIAVFLASCSVLPDRRDTKVIVNDENIESKAANILYGDTTINKKIHVNITSYNGIVLVSGEVLSEDLQQKVIDMVRNIPDVRRVHNELVVADLTSFESRTGDTWITSKVKSQMMGNKQLESNFVKVVTENDTVYLMGMVTEKEAEIAAQIASNVSGVKRVVTLFEYIPEPPPQPEKK
ncbi:MAG: BON domain-containing protein [Gammaproteobacteria bacterium]|nr:BON domain-containing protein [Gammaproteobacteria bacterium]